MAEYILDVLSQTSKLDWAFPFQRTGSFPIDRSAMFSSLADAQNYALGVAEGEEAKDERKLGGTSYVGQIISVYEAAIEANEEEGTAAVPASVNAYIITPTRGLMKLAATTASGDVGADVADLQGKVNTLMSQVESLQTAVDKKAEQSALEEEAARAKEAERVNAENIAKKADAEQVGKDIAAAIAPLAKQEDVYKKTETYSKSEVESYVQGQIGSAGHLKRVIVESLPLATAADADTIYMVKKTGGLVTNDIYEEYMVINGAWELIGDTYVDLSNYATTEYVDGEIDKVEGEVAKKADKTYVDDELVKKADKTYVDDELAKKADSEQVANDIAAAVAPLASKQYVDGELAKKAAQADFEDLQDTVNGKADKATTLEGYGISDAYTKKNVDDALLLKASQQDHNELVDVVNGKADKATTLAGYGITDAYTKDEVYTKSEVYAKDEVYTKGEADQAIADKISEVNGGESAGEVLGQLNAYKKTVNMEIWGNENGSGDSRIDVLEAVGAQANIIESITIEGEAIAPENKSVALPLALAAKAGLVRSAAVTDGKTADNSVSVDASGYMFVNSVNVNKLVQTTGEYLVLNGGAATV